MRDDVVLSVHNLSKRFLITNETARDDERVEDRYFWALRDISFDLHRGEMLGIIGQNGAGKSTLLKILAEIIPPTSGHVDYKGNILSILDIGTGFHPDLSGYENIFLNASLLGMKKIDIRRKADEIIAFSGIGDFINDPIRNYSSGMYLRLALSIALFTDNEVILLDEVISVGDIEFRLKAIQKIREHISGGRACIMISHDLNSVLELCNNTILLEKGKILYHGRSRETVKDYFDSIYSRYLASKKRRLEHSKCAVLSVTLSKESYQMDEHVNVSVVFEVKEQEDIRVVIKLRNYQSAVLSDSEAFRPNFQKRQLSAGIYTSECKIPARLLNAGTYFVDILLCSDKAQLVNYAFATKFVVTLQAWETGAIWNTSNETIPFRPICEWVTRPSGEQTTEARVTLQKNKDA